MTTFLSLTHAAPGLDVFNIGKPPNAVLSGGAAVTFLAAATDVVSGSVPVSYSINPGSTFPLGTTIVTASATDAAGNSSGRVYTITVESRDRAGNASTRTVEVRVQH